MQAFFSTLDSYTLRDVIASPTGEAIIRLHRSPKAQSADTTTPDVL
jgi:Rrf2 family nitric oxide-sensitive transcriptional repressor